MSDKRIYQLQEASVVGADDLLALDSSEFEETKKIKMSTLTKGLVYKESLTNLIINSDTNNTGSTITKGTVFYLYGELCIALVDIASGAEFTPDTNYDNITVGGQITEVKSALGEQSSASSITGDNAFSKINTVYSQLLSRGQAIGTEPVTIESLTSDLNNLAVGKYRWFTYAESIGFANLPNGNSSWAGAIYCFTGQLMDIQIAFEYDGSKIYYRVRYNGWKAWKQIQTA